MAARAGQGASADAPVEQDGLLQGEGKMKRINMKSQDMESLLVCPLIMKLSTTRADPAINEDQGQNHRQSCMLPLSMDWAV